MNLFASSTISIPIMTFARKLRSRAFRSSMPKVSTMYKKLLRLIIGTFFLWASQAVRGETAESPHLYEIPDFLSVKDAALKLSLQNKRAILLRGQAAIDKELVKYGYYPTVGLTATAGENRREIETSQQRDNDRNLTYGAQLGYRLYDFGRTGSQVLAADYQEKIQSLTIDEVNETLVWEVARAYLNYSMAAQLYQISYANLASSQAKYENVRTGYRQGLRPEADLVSAEADLGDIRLTLLQAEADAQLQRAYLKLYLGDYDFDKSPTGSPSPNKPTWVLRDAKAWQDLFQGWDEPEKSAAQVRRAVERESLEAEISAVNAASRPTLDLRLAAEEVGDWKDTDLTYTGQVLFTWDIVWPGQKRKQLQRISLERNVIDIDEAQELKTRREASSIALERFRLNSRLAGSAAAQVKLRAKQYQLARSRYESGKATSLELSNSELLLGNSRLVEARIINALSAAALDYAFARKIKDPSVLFH